MLGDLVSLSFGSTDLAFFLVLHDVLLLAAVDNNLSLFHGNIFRAIVH
jgi:hypothetical protein